MHFSVTGGGIGLIGGLVLFGALMVVFTIVVTVIICIVRGPDDPTDPAVPSERAPEDDYIL